MKLGSMFILTALCFLISGTVFSQDGLDDVHLFQAFLRDAPITSTIYAEGGLDYWDYENGSTLYVGAQGGYPINPQIEVNAGLDFVNISPDKGDGQSGLSDLTIAGRYAISPKNAKISAGGFLTLPIGEEKVGASKLNFGGFGALRHPLNNGMVITATMGLDFLETTNYEGDSDRETSLVLGGGAIYPTSDHLNVIGELMLKTKIDYLMLSGGADYKLQAGSRVRGALGIGLDDGAPDLTIMFSFLHFFK